jgi:hypothetical protein
LRLLRGMSQNAEHETTQSQTPPVRAPDTQTAHPQVPRGTAGTQGQPEVCQISPQGSIWGSWRPNLPRPPRAPQATLILCAALLVLCGVLGLALYTNHTPRKAEAQPHITPPAGHPLRLAPRPTLGPEHQAEHHARPEQPHRATPPPTPAGYAAPPASAQPPATPVHPPPSEAPASPRAPEAAPGNEGGEEQTDGGPFSP